MSDNTTMLGGVPLRPPDPTKMQLSMLLWGDAGVGKTTLAMTAPGRKLLMLFDHNGDMSIANRSDVEVMNLSGMHYLQVVEKFRSPDPFGLEAFLKSHPEFETLVIDSVTAYAYLALQEAVSKNKSSSIEQPGVHGYTMRNATMLRAVHALLSITQRLGRNIIFTTHEGTPSTDTEGRDVSVTMLLSASSANQLSMRINEVWHMTDTGTAHTIAVRPCRLRKPMKTRMWNAVKPEFTWRYDPIKNTGDGIDGWLNAWRKNGGNKLSLPA